MKQLSPANWRRITLSIRAIECRVDMLDEGGLLFCGDLALPLGQRPRGASRFADIGFDAGLGIFSASSRSQLERHPDVCSRVSAAAVEISGR